MQFPLRANRWASFVGGIFLMLSSGTIYLFSSYKGDLQNELKYSTEDINLVGTMANAGTWAGVFAGLLFDAYGPRLSNGIGSTLLGLGYLLFYLGANGTIKFPTAFTLGLCAFTFGQGSSFCYTTALNTNAINFEPQHRGKVVGLLVSFFGLCSGFYTQIYSAFFEPHATKFLAFMAIATCAVTAVCTLFMNFTGPDSSGVNTLPRYYCGLTLCILIVSYLTAINLLEVFDLHAGFVNKSVLTIILVAVFSPYLALPFFGGEPVLALAGPKKDDDDTRSELGARLLDEPDNQGDTPTTTAVLKEEPKDATLVEVFTSIDYWLIFICFLTGVGSGITLQTNITGILESRVSYGTSVSQDKDAMLSMFSVFNTLGRICSGILSDSVTLPCVPYHMTRSSMRAFWLACALVLMSACQFGVALDGPVWTMWPISVCLGLAYGSLFCLIPTMVSEYFGLKNFGASFCFAGIAPAVGSYLLSTMLAGKMVDKYATKGVDGKQHCYDEPDCFRTTMFTTGGVSLVGFLVALVLLYSRFRKDLANHAQSGSGQSGSVGARVSV